MTNPRNLLLLPCVLLTACFGGKDTVDSGQFDRDGDGFVAEEDCDDRDEGVNPDADEICDGVDNDCSGAVDDDPVDGVIFYPDSDQDGFGDAANAGENHCAQPSGYTTDNTDCGDGDPLVYPDASEACNGGDDDCDDSVDEDFDVDGDTYFSQVECADGDDCDDEDPDAHPEAEEIPYDGIDQDCDGADLLDVDGDGFNGFNEDGNPGNDCDDTDADVSPVGTEIEFDGIDQDCDGFDDVDGDNDGYDHEDYEGDDCDDTDPDVHPGSVDFMNDGVDSDCDEADGGTLYLADAKISISGGSGELLGYAVNACDIDDDGLDDLVVSVPFGSSYSGQVGVFLGSGYASWTAGMQITDADYLITGGTYGFFGFQTICDDFDGDGFDDIVTEQGEIQYSVYVSDFSLYLFYGGTGWTQTMSTQSAHAKLAYPMGGPNQPTVFSAPMSSGDVTDDGNADIILSAGHRLLSIFDGGERVLVVPGQAWSGNSDLDDSIVLSVTPEQPNQYAGTSVLSDLDGDGYADLFVGSTGYSENYEDYDSADPDFEFSSEGFAHFIGDATGGGEVDLSDAAYASQAGQYEGHSYGWNAIMGDFDGDGSEDLVVSMSGDDGEDEDATESTGGLYLFSNPSAELIGTDLDPTSLADGWGTGDMAYGYLGWTLESIGDLNDDGYDDLFVSEPCSDYVDEFGTSLSSCNGRAYVISGELFSGEITDWEDAALLRWESDNDYATTGNSLAAGDFDGDGQLDFVIAEYDYGSSSFDGRVSVSLSSDW